MSLQVAVLGVNVNFAGRFEDASHNLEGTTKLSLSS